MDDKKQQSMPRWLVGVLLVLIMVAGGYLRTMGLDWDAGQHLHPDERFLTMVESSLEPASGLGEYFDTGESPLNPNNRGHGFYVYGTLPIFLVRYVAEWIGQTGYGGVYLVGRSLSGLVDLLTVLLVFFLGSRLYNRRVGLIGAAFSAFAVLQIQQAHFFTVDTFTTFFMILTLYFAAEVATAAPGHLRVSSFALFGLGLGMAAASKINAVPIALTLPLAAGIHLLRHPEADRPARLPRLVGFLALGGFTSLLVFRIFQPYAFSGPGFWGLIPNDQWISGLKSLRAQTAGDVDFPPALQWARRPYWFSFQNMVVWGMGLPYGLLAWSGFLAAGWQMVRRGKWEKHLLLWSWTGLYFLWQSLQWNSTLRYQLPIYPLLALYAGWAVHALLESARDGWKWSGLGIKVRQQGARLLSYLLLALILLSTAAWAAAFAGIYPEKHPRVEATRWIFNHIPGAVTLRGETAEGERQQLLSYPGEHLISSDQSWQTTFQARFTGEIEEIILPAVQSLNGNTGELGLSIRLEEPSGTRSADLTGQVSLVDGEGEAVFSLANPFPVAEEVSYSLVISLVGRGEPVKLQGAALANESSWDDGLPLRMEGYDPFGGIYQGGLNFEMYWDDNPEKLDRFLAIMEQADYILITSSRQWASTTRVPERYPLTTRYYRELMGCPEDQTVENCYNMAQEGKFQGDLGFDLVRVFESKPRLGPMEINDQFAEEAFTVYDHPKVFIFRKTAAYDQAQTARILGEVDLEKVIHLTPKEADNYPGDLMLPPARLAQQREGGTWDRLFNVNSVLNSSQPLGALVWYLSLWGLGLLVYPLVRQVFSGLDDRGYPLSRLVGLLLLSYLYWLAGSVRVPATRMTIGGILLFLAVILGGMAYRQRSSLQEEWRNRRRTFWIVEGLALTLFIGGLLIRFGNPDLWHPWKGGEKPMDFSYFNAVIKSTSFPPYDPWFAGGYINYYYYGFVLVGVLVELLGIVPALAYNLIMPTLLMFIGLGGFSVAWNISRKGKTPAGGLVAGAGGALSLVFLGNLGTVRMIFRGLQQLAAAGGDVTQASLFKKILGTFQGLGHLGGARNFPFRLDDWYWIPSRAIAAEHGGPITEFPAFTFLYGDLHAHFIALPLTLLVIAWSASVVFQVGGNRNQTPRVGKALLTAAAGGLFVGALRPTNTWDFYPYLALGACALMYSWWKGAERVTPRRLGQSAAHAAVFVLLSFVLFQPYTQWYGQAYNEINAWTGTRTPLMDYLTHWGLFLFLILSWMGYETLEWMAQTPVSALNKLSQVKELLLAALVILLVVTVGLGVELGEGVRIGEFTVLGAGVHIVWLVLPLLVWAGILLLRPDQTDAKRLVLFFIGTALALTLVVEVIRLEGDIGRMNTVFKFYLQAWTLLAVSAGASLAWLISSWSRWPERFRGIWQLTLTVLVAGAALYPLLAGSAKVKDRMAPEAPYTLNGMTFLKYAEYQDLGTSLDLSQDYHAIRWLQENVSGSPVIVEANQVEYHWGSRYTVYTGLPGVVGWNWHQRQQRNLTPHAWVFERVEGVHNFYNSTDLGAARDFIRNYDVEYIIVGGVERAKYDPEGLEKFTAAAGVLWEEVYQREDTRIYRSLIDN